MAGLPLKSGADFYNLEAARLRLHNLGADPTEVGAGLIYFNTSTGLNTSQKARLYTGSAWKTIAFSEDLDVASNADFLALKDKVDTLIGDGVDMDGIIESWKEVEAFLSGMSDTKSLMDLLNGKADKTQLANYLPLSGGTINGSLTLNEGALYFISGGKQYAYNVSTGNGEPIYLKNDAWHTLLHSGNVGEYKAGDADKLGGVSLNRFVYGDNATKTKGISEDDFENPLASGFYAIINASNLPTKTSYNTALHVSFNAENLRAGFDFLIGDYQQSPLYFRPANGNGVGDWKTIAFTDSNVASATYASAARALVDAQDGKSVAYVSGNTFYIGDAIYPTTSTQIMGKDVRLRYGANASFGFWLNESGNVTIGASDLAGNGCKLFVDGVAKFKQTDGTIINLETSADSQGGAGISFFGADGFKRGTITASSLLLNAIGGGNVLIGTNTDNGSGAKLQVAGAVTMASTLSVEGQTTLSSLTFSSANTISIDGNGNIKLSAKSGTYWNVATPNGINALTCYYNGNVGIGTTDPQEKLDIEGGIRVNGHIYPKWGNNADLGKNAQRWNNIFAVKASFTEDVIIDGDLHVKGNIIADGEVSAGGAAEEGGNAGSGAGAFYSDIIKKGATQTTMAHGLGTDDIVVSIYEKDGVSGRWSIILTDVEIVDANNIIVSFGSATTVEHKVVIMGAVA